MIEHVHDLYAYNAWANDRILDAVEALDAEAFTRDLGGSFGSIRGTLVHLVSAEWVWLERWKGRSPSGLDTGWTLETVADLRGRLADVERERSVFLARLDDGALEAPLEYQNTRGEPFRSPLWRLLRHVVNHGTWHRGQISLQLRLLGRPGVSTDMVLFDRQRGEG